MLDNEILKKSLKNKFKKLNIDENEEDNLVAELNYLSNFLIDIYLANKNV